MPIFVIAPALLVWVPFEEAIVIGWR